MRVLAGTSGWSYPAWKGSFYPADLPAARMLPAYAARLPAVEVNATFHRLPAPATVARWAAQVPPGFRFALKGPQRVTHVRRLEGVEDLVAAFHRAAAELGPALGAILWQPHSAMRKDAGRLREFLALLPRGGRAAIELRHPSWHDDEIHQLLADAGAALCVTDADDLATPLVPTARFGYLRLRRAAYDAGALRAWAARVRAQPWDDAFVFFKHEDEARGPAFAVAFQAVAGEGERADAR